MNEGQAICLKCGVAAGKGKGFCAHCGEAVNENAEVCLKCGFKIETEEEAAEKKAGDLGGQDKMAMALVCFFLGGIGIHNFMMGEKRRGIMKIIFCFLCGISGILALIDFVKILTDRYVVDRS